ncbi:heterokaryon incompatibility protein domain-containing protein [Neurospora intermedia]|uniref:Heterokaryon incompatibility protein domain-containing protein n=1 Tax=Neurospora intermedia TaxID=5142 RepID=A0ABR3D5Z6_NEUIN
MRLLSTREFTFHEFPEDAVPAYAILSHTWNGDEITMQNMQQPDARMILQSGNPPDTSPWKKIQGACEMASQCGYFYIWIDSCCIDKTNSAELQEAINSMFRWYRNSSLCLALLSDVNKSYFQLDRDLQANATLFCRWFTRGWTLQELLAPDHLVFFDVNWEELGSRSEWVSDISKATGIDVRFLLSIEWDPLKRGNLEAVLRDTSVATKMSWAAGRQTTRMEDQAYCLLGLFDIYMPMLYGEGTKAFARLQQEIMRSTDDCTLLAWGYNEPLLGAPISEFPIQCRCCRCDQYHRDHNLTPSVQDPHLPSCAYADVTTGCRGGVLVGGHLFRDLSGHNAGGQPRSLLAASPRESRFVGSLEPCGIPGHKRPTFAMSQRGLEISLPIIKDESHHHIVYGLLACSPKVKMGGSYLVAVPLIRLSVIDAASAGQDDEYVQSPFCLPCKVPVSFSAEAERMSICIRNEDRCRRLWDSVGYLEGSMVFDFGHPLARKREESTLRLELMYPSQPLCSMYFTLLRDSCPDYSKSSAPFHICPGEANLDNSDWWSYHLTRPSPHTTIAAAVLNIELCPLHPYRLSKTRILLVVSTDLSCRVRKLAFDKEVDLRTLMTIASQSDLVGPKLESERREVKEFRSGKETRIVYKLLGGIELCLRTWC